jgi:excisionase family DNA binding protein
VTAVSQGRDSKAPGAGALASSATTPPRLLTVEQAAQYLALGLDTVYALVSQGVLRRVRIPAANGNEIRRVLLDRLDLDRAIEAWRERA